MDFDWLLTIFFTFPMAEFFFFSPTNELLNIVLFFLFCYKWFMEYSAFILGEKQAFVEESWLNLFQFLYAPQIALNTDS